MKFTVDKREETPDYDQSELPVLLKTAGEVVNVPYHSTPGSKEGDWMVTIFLGDGQGEYRNSCITQTVTGGMAGLVNCDDPGVLLSCPENPYHHFYCRFTGKFASTLAGRIRESREKPFFCINNSLECADCLRKIGRLYRNPPHKEFGPEEALLLQVLALLNKDQAVSHREQPLKWVDVESYLQRHLSENLDLSSTAEHFHLSRSAFNRLIKSATGLTYQQNLEKMRMDWAAVLIRETNLNMGQTAERTGYRDPLYFSRVFKKNFGLSPRDWSGQIKKGLPGD